MTITDKAAEKALKILAGEGKSNWGLRIFVTGMGCCGPSYGLDMQEKQLPGDEVVEKNGLKVYLDAETLSTLAGKQLDYYVGVEGEGFIFTGGMSACGTGGGCSSCGD